MKKTLLCSVLLLLVFNLLQAQIVYDYVFHEPHGVIHGIDVNSDRYLVAAGASEPCPEGFVAFLNPEGRLFWQKSLEEYLSPATDVIFDYEGNIVVTGSKSTTDDAGFPNDGIYLLKVDNSGTTLFYKRLRRGYHLGEKVQVRQLPDSTYLAAGRNLLFRIAPNGDSLYTQELPLNRIIDISVRGDSTLVVLSRDKALFLTSGGETIDEWNAEPTFIGVSSKNDTTWLLETQQMWVLVDGQFTPVNFPVPENFAPAGITSSRNGDGVLIWGENNSERQFYQFSAGSWSQKEIDWVPGTNIEEVLHYGDHYFFAGSDRWEDPSTPRPMEGAFISARARGVFSTPMITSDIGIERVAIGLSSPIDTFDRIFHGDTLVAVGVSGWYEGEIEVINRGAFEVEEFVLSSSRQGGFNCSEGRAFFGLIDTVRIPPDEVRSIRLRFRDFTYLDPNTGGVLERCFFVAAPDHQFDQYAPNNAFCATLLTSADEPELEASAVSVFPNPAGEVIRIRGEGDLQIESLQLFDLSGRQLFVPVELNYQEGLLYRGHLGAGLYLLKVKTERGVVIKRILFH